MNALTRVANDVIRRRRADVTDPDWKDLQYYLGKELNKLLLEDETALALFEDRIQEGLSRGQPLRILINTGEAESAALPWELLTWDKADNPFLAQSQKTPIARVVRPLYLARVWNAREPIRILVAGASPLGRAPANVQQETVRIQQALKHLGNRVDVRSCREVKLTTLTKEMKDYDPHILHVIAHGEPSAIEFENDEGDVRKVTSQELAERIAFSAPSLSLFVTTACESAMEGSSPRKLSIARALSKEGVPAVVAMQFEIRDEIAIKFVHQFYSNLGHSENITTSLTAARLEIKDPLPDSPEWASPVLFLSHNHERNDVVFSPTIDWVIDRLHQDLKPIQDAYWYLSTFKKLPHGEFVDALIDNVNDTTQRLQQLATILGQDFPANLADCRDTLVRLVPDIRKSARYILQSLDQYDNKRTDKIEGEFYEKVEDCVKMTGLFITEFQKLLELLNEFFR